MDTTQIGDAAWVALVQEKMKTVKNGRPLTDEELRRLTYTCRTRQLDPLLNHIHCMFYKEKGSDERTVSFQTSIDAFRLIAARTQQYAGSDEPKFVEKDGKVVSCSVTVYRLVGGIRCPFAAIAFMTEYAPHPAVAQYTLWPKMPHVMLAKCAEAAALRKGFPDELSGLYVEEEMDQQKTDPRHDNPRYQALQTALKGARLSGQTFAHYLQSEHRVSAFSDLPEETQAVTLDAITQGAVTQWARGLTDSVATLARSKQITPAQLADECTKRFNEPALAKLSHAQRLELADAIVQGEIVPQAPPPAAAVETKGELRDISGTVANFTRSNDICCLTVRTPEKDYYLYYRASALPEGMPVTVSEQDALRNVSVRTHCELLPNKKDPKTKLLTLRSIAMATIEQEQVAARVVLAEASPRPGEYFVTIEGHRDAPEIVITRRPLAEAKSWQGKTLAFTLRTTTAEHRMIVAATVQHDAALTKEDDIPDKAEDFRGAPPPVDRVPVKVFAVAAGSRETPNSQPTALIEFEDKQSEQVTFAHHFTEANAKGIEGAHVLLDLIKTTPLRTITRIEMITPAPEKKGASSAFRDKMDKRMEDRKLKTVDTLSTEALVAQAASLGISAQDLNGYCLAEYGMDLDDLPEEERAALKHNLTDGAVKTYADEVAALFMFTDTATA